MTKHLYTFKDVDGIWHTAQGRTAADAFIVLTHMQKKQLTGTFKTKGSPMIRDIFQEVK